MRGKAIDVTTGRLSAGILASVLMAMLAGCGGGSSGSAGIVAPPVAAPTPPVTPAPAPPTTPTNRAPTISGSPPAVATAGAPYSFQPTASDPDGDSLTFSASGLPAWLTISSSTGQLSGTLPAGSTGTIGDIIVSVSDGKASASLPAFSITVAVTALGFADLIWSAPTQNVDGSALTNLAGYKVRYGQSPGALTQLRDIAGAGTTSVRIDGLAAGTWYFTLACYTNSGVESAPTGTVSKSII